MTREAWLIEADIPKEGMYGAEAIVTTASTVLAIVFQVFEKRTQEFGIQILHFQVIGLAVVMFRSKFEQEIYVLNHH